MSFSPSLYKIPFDQFSRQYIAYKIVEDIRSGDEKIKILDVGGHGGRTREFFPDDDVTVLDLYDIKEPWYVKASALDMPFKDEEFDVVLSFDVLEHIAKDDRETFLTEALRVAKKATLTAAPFHTKYVEEAEKALNDYHVHLCGEPHQWLGEHIEYGLPAREFMQSYFERNNLSYDVVHSNNLNNWELLQFTVLLTVSSNVSSEYIDKMYEFYNRNLNRLGDFDEDSYRSVYIAYKDFPKSKSNLSSIFKSAHYPPAQLELSTLVFKHIAAMQNRIKTVVSSQDLTWYMRINEMQQETINNLRLLSHQRETELNTIRTSRSWRVVQLLRLPRRIISKIVRSFRHER